jgi:protein-disulfide isomerase
MDTRHRTVGWAWLGPYRSTVWLTLLMLLPMSGGVGATGPDVEGGADVRMRGNPRAPVTLVEYSDFTCGFCKKFFLETWPRIQAKYIETGKVRFVYRDYPRASQGPGLDAAVAARCAGDQDRYWPMHDRLFATRIEQGELQRHAKTIGLDLPTFSKCLKDDRHMGGILRDKEEGLGLGFRGTPGFLLVRTNGSEKGSAIAIPGAFPFEVFEEQIDRLLNVVGPGPTPSQ